MIVHFAIALSRCSDKISHITIIINYSAYSYGDCQLSFRVSKATTASANDAQYPPELNLGFSLAKCVCLELKITVIPTRSCLRKCLVVARENPLTVSSSVCNSC